MKILVIQLARFGDIYQTLPTLKGLRSKYPDSEITLLVREKFKEAALSAKGVASIVGFDTATVLAPILFSPSGEVSSLKKLNEQTQALKSDYDLIVNLSFSPFSSYLTDELRSEKTVVKGYSRTTDGFLSLPDDVSAYFYAQVGTFKKNRIHLTDLFAMVAGVEDVDNRVSLAAQADKMREGLVVQIGASQKQKTLTSDHWSSLLEFVHSKTATPIYIVGSKEDAGVPLSLSKLPRISDLRGQTTLEETFCLIENSRALIAPDSVTLHMASLVDTPTFNISKGDVRFWETGPRAIDSRVYFYTDETEKNDLQIELGLFLSGEDPQSANVYSVTEKSGVIYSGKKVESSFSWNLIKALYMDGDYPPAQSHKTELALQRIQELVSLGLEQLENIKNPRAQSVAVSILNEIDFLMNQVTRIDSEVAPLVNWFITQKIRIADGPFHVVLSDTQKVFEDMAQILLVYSKVSWSLAQEKELSWKP